MDSKAILLKKFGYNKPISINEIRETLSNLSTPRVAQIVDSLLKNEEIVRYSRGVYFFPTTSIFGRSTLDSFEVITKKYIASDENIYGFYSGLTFKNIINLTTQVPNVIEITTNKEKSRARIVTIGGQKVLLKKSRVYITNENYKTLQILEFINEIDENEVIFSKQLINKYIADNALNIKEMTRLAMNFPSKTLRKLMILGLFDAIAWAKKSF